MEKRKPVPQDMPEWMKALVSRRGLGILTLAFGGGLALSSCAPSTPTPEQKATDYNALERDKATRIHDALVAKLRLEAEGKDARNISVHKGFVLLFSPRGQGVLNLRELPYVNVNDRKENLAGELEEGSALVIENPLVVDAGNFAHWLAWQSGSSLNYAMINHWSTKGHVYRMSQTTQGIWTAEEDNRVSSANETLVSAFGIDPKDQDTGKKYLPVCRVAGSYNQTLDLQSVLARVNEKGLTSMRVPMR